MYKNNESTVKKFDGVYLTISELIKALEVLPSDSKIFYDALSGQSQKILAIEKEGNHFYLIGGSFLNENCSESQKEKE